MINFRFLFSKLKKIQADGGAKASGYGLAMLLVFLGTTVAIGTSLQLMSGPLSVVTMGSASQNRLAAEELAKAGLTVVSADIQDLYNKGQTIPTSGYPLNAGMASDSVTMPVDPANLAVKARNVGAYTGVASYVGGNVYLIKVTASVGSSQVTLSKLLTLSQSIYPLDKVSGATVAYGLRRLTSNANITKAIRVRRSSDNTETDIGFLPNGDLDTPTLLTFLNTGLTTYPKPLDRVGSASAAYSLRKLRTAYTGNAITVRRSSDDATNDIGFLPNGDLDTLSLIKFCGSASCYVTTWYDQSGNGNHQTQTTTASQPIIVNAGALITVNGRPAIRFDGTDDWTQPTALNITNNFTVIALARPTVTHELDAKGGSGSDGTSGQRYLIGPRAIRNAAGDSEAGFSVGTNGAAIYNHSTGGISAVATAPLSIGSNLAIITMTYTNKLPYLYVNSQLSDVGFAATTPNIYAGSSIGGPTYLTYFAGEVSEMIYYPTALSTTNRQIVENDETRYYQLTLPDVGYVNPLDTVTGASAAFSLRKLRSAATLAIEVRRSNDNATSNIGFDAKGNLDVVTLLNFCGTNSCFVKTWYDQSGSNRNATQATAANQPRIVNAGVLEIQQGRPAVRFINSGPSLGTFLSLPSIPFGSDGTFVGSLRALQNNWGRVFDFNNSSTTGYAFFSTNGKAAVMPNGGGGETQLLYSVDNTASRVYSLVRANPNGTVYRDGVLVQNNGAMLSLSVSPSTNNWLGKSAFIGVDDYLDALVGELVFYNTALSTTNRQILENNQMAYYNINSTGPDTGFVTKWYNQAAADQTTNTGLDLSQSNYSLQPAIRFDAKTGRPFIQFNGLNNYMTTANTLSFTSNQATALAVATMSSSSGTFGRLFSGRKNSDPTDYLTTDSGVFFCRNSGNGQLAGWRLDAPTPKGQAAITLNQIFQATSTFNGANHTMRLNSVLGTSVASSGNFNINQFWLGLSPHYPPGDRWGGSINEVILYPTVVSGDPLTVLERDQRNYYGTP